MNDESKVRKSAKGYILGRRAKKGEGAVMGWNELEGARAKRAEEAAAAAARSAGKRGGKRQAKKARRSDVRSEVEAEGQGASAWRAPEAPMLHTVACACSFHFLHAAHISSHASPLPRLELTFPKTY
jgi:hypothetical protein